MKFKLQRKFDDGLTITWNINMHEPNCKCDMCIKPIIFEWE